MTRSEFYADAEDSDLEAALGVQARWSCGVQGPTAAAYLHTEVERFDTNEDRGLAGVLDCRYVHIDWVSY